MRTYSVFIVLLTVIVINLITAQTVQFKVPIVIQSGNYTDTLWVGVSGDGEGGAILDNTYGLDVKPIYGLRGQWREMMHPPDFPTVRFNAKFVNTPGRREMGGTGMKPYDFRGFTSISQIDTFAIRIYGDSLRNNPLILSWPKNLKEYGNAWQLIKRQGKTYTVVVSDMTNTKSYTEPAEGLADQTNYLLIKSGVVVKK